MGDAAYDELAVRCEAHLDTVRRARSAGARTLLPLLVHPATLEADAVGGRRPRVPRRQGAVAEAAPGANQPAHPVPPGKGAKGAKGSSSA